MDYSKLELVTIFIRCQDKDEVTTASLLLRQLMSACNDFEHHALVRRLANNKISLLTKNQ